MKDFLKQLNTHQKQAVTHGNGPLLIVAGAGTGKTTVLINRLAYLILEKDVNQDSILLLTFTEKAASELEERADLILPYGYVDNWISTFHSFAEKILRDYGMEIGLNPAFKLLTQTEQWVLIKKNLDKFELNYYKPLGNPNKFISELIKYFSRLKDENISPEEYRLYVESIKDSEEIEDQEKDRQKELSSAYITYTKLLLDNNFLDFGDLIFYVLKLFNTRKNILNYYQQKFSYIMVDEFQDTNLAQYELIKMLSKPDNNLTVVGDDNQAIYKFRGASLSNILQFKDDYKEAVEIVLNENFRSRQEILDRAYQLIQNNNPNTLEYKLKINKELKAKNSNYIDKKDKDAVSFFNLQSHEEEVTFVVDKIRDLKEKDKEAFYSDFAILVRANDTADAYIKELGRHNIPNQFMSWRGLYYKPVILDIIAYFRLLDNYHESSACFRVLNMETFKVSHLDLVNINKMANRKAWSLFEALQNISKIRNISSKSVVNIKKLLTLISEHSKMVANSSPSQIFLKFAYDSGFLESYDFDRDIEIFSYLNQFYQKIKTLEQTEIDLKLKDFLTAIDLELEAGETGSLKLDFVDSDSVKIMTVHGAKGLEFKYVFLVNLVDKKFPTINRSEKISIPEEIVKEKTISDGDIHTEEERRLFYVAITRAKDKLFLTGAKDYGGAREKKPSRFINELGLEKIIEPEIKLSEKNEFLKDLHFVNLRNMEKDEKSSEEKLPLPEKFSFSQLAAFSNCPLQYKFAFILKIPAATDKASLVFGRVMHNTLYNFLLPALSERSLAQGNLFPLSKEEAEKLFSLKRLKELYSEFWQNDGYESKKQREEYRKKGEESLKLFYENYTKLPPKEVIYLEKRFSFKIKGDVIKGAIDRVDLLEDGTLEIVDYKTGSPKDKLAPKDKKQLILYQLFLEDFLGKKVSLLSYYYLENGQKMSFTPKEKDIEKVKLEIINEISEIKKRNFPPKPSHLCKYCDFNRICEFKQN
ncbi:MAG: UvrD-helicase domain-containing protein [Patescibacteria group bacterium]|jgi:DNA helicase-2/ATP-dependent DNA helicase PcrA|nr:UvrD-helicase domain-containing protein [Patescibacteria group bacterium]